MCKSDKTRIFSHMVLLILHRYQMVIGKTIERILEKVRENNEKLKTCCSNEVKINNIELLENCLTVDLSKNFIETYNGENDNEIKVVYCIVNTLTELTEVDSVKILIEGQENQYLGKVKLSEKYYRINN